MFVMLASVTEPLPSATVRNLRRVARLSTQRHGVRLTGLDRKREREWPVARSDSRNRWSRSTSPAPVSPLTVPPIVNRVLSAKSDCAYGWVTATMPGTRSEMPAPHRLKSFNVYGPGLPLWKICLAAKRNSSWLMPAAANADARAVEMNAPSSPYKRAPLNVRAGAHVDFHGDDQRFVRASIQSVVVDAAIARVACEHARRALELGVREAAVVHEGSTPNPIPVAASCKTMSSRRTVRRGAGRTTQRRRT